MAETPSLTQLVEALCAEQRRRWQDGERVSADTYLDRHPTLASSPDCAVELVYNEVLLREEQGETPLLDEYLRRFPQLAVQLRRLFEVHGAMDRDSLFHIPEPDTADAEATVLPVVPGYELLGELGHGGMGIVYQARHLALGRIVALKMIKAGVHADAAERARLKAEAEAAARLQHPNLVQIFDVGEADGCPYLALEYVAGGSLARRLGGTPQPAREAARLVETLARAVHHAHQHGIVHRDLKPANVLLSFSGEPKATTPHAVAFGSPLNGAVPKIADFGLAKRLEDTAGQTRTGDVMGTPSYMSPEQAAGKVREVGPAADGYALGAILYEMLTGRPPFLGESPLDTLELVKTQEPVPPRRLQPKVPRDLETICLKCLQKEPRRRYADAAALAEDLRRFQGGEPIRARPVGRAERLWRWTRRNPRVAGLAAALVSALVAGSIGSTWLGLVAAANARKEKAERQRAEENLLKGRQAVYRSFVIVSTLQLPREPGAQAVQKQLLQDALAFFQDFRRQRPDDPELRADVAEAHFRVGLILDKIGTPQQALAELLPARDLLGEVVQERPDDLRPRELQAVCWQLLGRMYHRLGKRQEAQACYEQARAFWTALLKKQPGSPTFRKGLAKADEEIGLLLQEAGRHRDALPCYERAAEVFDQLVRDDPADGDSRRELAYVRHHLALLKNETGDLEGARAANEQALDMRRQLAAENPADPDLAYDVASSYQNLAGVQKKLGRFQDTLTSHQEVLKRLQKLVEANPAVVRYRRALGLGYNNYGLFLGDLGKAPEGLELCKVARDLQEKLVGEQPGDVQLLADLAASHGNVGLLLRAAKQPQESLNSYWAALALWGKLDADHPGVPIYQSDLALCHSQIGSLSRAAGDLAQALKSYQQSREIRERLVKDHPGVPIYQSDLAGSYYNLALLHLQAGRFDAALRDHQTAWDLRVRLVAAYPASPQYRNELAASYSNLGRLLGKLDRLGEAIDCCRHAIRERRRVVDAVPAAPSYRMFLSDDHAFLAMLLRLKERPAEAAAEVLECKRLWPADADTLYAVACGLAQCVPLVGKGKTELPAAEQAERQKYAAQALETLREAVAVGFKDVERLKKDPRLAGLRPRDDFQKLLAELDRPAKP